MKSIAHISGNEKREISEGPDRATPHQHGCRCGVVLCSGACLFRNTVHIGLLLGFFPVVHVCLYNADFIFAIKIVVLD